ALLPFVDYGLRRLVPDAASSGVHDLSTAVTLISVLPLLIARIAAERSELQQAGTTTKLLVDVIEQAKDLILVMTPDGRCRHANRFAMPPTARRRSCATSCSSHGARRSSAPSPT